MAVMKSLGHAKGDPKFQNHWNTFITEADIAEIGIYSFICFINEFIFYYGLNSKQRVSD